METRETGSETGDDVVVLKDDEDLRERYRKVIDLLTTEQVRKESRPAQTKAAIEAETLALARQLTPLFEAKERLMRVQELWDLLARPMRAGSPDTTPSEIEEYSRTERLLAGAIADLARIYDGYPEDLLPSFLFWEARRRVQLPQGNRDLVGLESPPRVVVNE